MSSKKRSRSEVVPAKPQIMSDIELSRLGKGEVGYIKVLTADKVREIYPSLTGLSKSVNMYFALHAANGDPLALTDTLFAAVGHADESELDIAPLQ
jgi:hypothetical protein